MENNTEINTDLRVLFLGSLFLWTKKRLLVSVKTSGQWAVWHARRGVTFTYTLLLQSRRLRRLAEAWLVAAIYFHWNVPMEYVAFFSFTWKFCPDFNSLWPAGHFRPSGFNSVFLWLTPWCSSPLLLSPAEYATKCKCFLVCLLI